MQTYLFEIYAAGDENYTYQEIIAQNVNQAREKLLNEIPRAYIVQIFTLCTEKVKP